MNSKTDPNKKLNRRGSESKDSEPRFLVIGQVAKAHGVRGEVSVIPHTDLPERFFWLDEVYLGDRSPVPVAVEGVRFHKGRPLLKLAGFETRESAQELRGRLLQVPEDQAIPLEEDEYFLHQLKGLEVVTADGRSLGTLVDVIETGANNVFVVHGSYGESLVPDIPDVISEIDFVANRMTITPFAGLLDA